MYSQARKVFETVIKDIKDDGLYKEERVLMSPQSPHVTTIQGKEVISFCANNYLGLSADTRVIEAAKKSYEKWGYGLSSVRFIIGTQEIHKRLENKLSDFLGMEDTILYSSCYDANGGLFESLLDERDAIISDALNHASIIDGIRLCKARRYRYDNSSMADLEKNLMEARENGARIIMIATDGVFSMDGLVADLKGIVALAKKYQALVMVDDSHATGFMGKSGRGTHEYADVMGEIDIITGTFGKALGGASGGFTSGKKEIIDILRQKSRPYLFSNSLAPAIAATTCEVLEILSGTSRIRDQLFDNTHYFREQMKKAGFDIKEGEHPIVPVMLYDAAVAKEMAERLLMEGIYVIGFYYPVVPRGGARIRVQISAAHKREELDLAIAAFVKVKKEMGL